MAGFRKMVSMERTVEEKIDASLPTVMTLPDVPYGHCISLTEVELEKLELDDDCEVGDMIDLRAMAKVTSVSKTDTGGGPKCRIELCITDLAIEDEDEEDEDEE